MQSARAGRLTRRRLACGVAAPAAGSLAAATLPFAVACGTGASASAPAPGPAGLSGTFELLTQSGDFINPAQQHAITTFRERHPEVTITLSPVAFADLPTKIRTAAAAGSGPDGYFHYSHMWRGVNAASVMLPLTPQLFKRNELERLTYANLLGSVRGKADEVYLLPTLVGMDGCNLLYNPSLLRTANVDVKALTSIEQVQAAATRMIVRQGDSVTRAGLNHASIYNVLANWILDQGGTLYDERARKWTWQTDPAERAVQSLLDDYYARRIAWLETPPGLGDPLANGHVAMWLHGAYTLFRYATQFPEAGIEDIPAPGFVPGKPAHYFQRGIAGYSLSPLLKGDSAKVSLGTAFFRHLMSPDGALGIADNYSGAILLKSVYEDPRFKQTRFGPARAAYPQSVIARMVVLGYGADDADFATRLNAVVRREVSTKGMLQELQQVATQREEEAQRTLG